jgi:flagellar hook-length control protein FliK
MLQTLNIPSSPLPEAPSAPPGTPGDAGERAEFAQLLQQAKGAEADTEHDTPTVPSPKEARIEPRARPGAMRSAHEHKPHDARRAGDDAESKDVEAIDLSACMRQEPLTDALATAADEAQPEPTPKAQDSDASTACADAALPVLMQVSERLQAHATQLPTQAAADERNLGARAPLRTAARDLRLPTRADAATATPADGLAVPQRSSADIALPNGKDAAFDLALRQAAGARSTAAPLFDRVPLDSTPAAAHAAAFARELQQPLATNAVAVAEAALRSAPDEAGFAPAFGAQVALWVKDGVQEARLHLHPAELGPVTVQIALEGLAAHIDFTAAVAATRESIEQSLPALAAALRESGFTLAGGGVFGRSGQGANDPNRERAPEGRGQGTRGTAAIATGDTGEVTTAVPPRWARSLVDVYA